MSSSEEILQQVNSTQNKITQSLTQQKDNLELLNDKLDKVAEFAKNNYINKDLISELSTVSSTNNEMVDNINVSLNDMLRHNAMNVPDEGVPDESVSASESLDTSEPEVIGESSSMATSEMGDDSGYQSSISAVPSEDIDRQQSNISEMSDVSESDLQNPYSNIDEEMEQNMNANFEPSDAYSDVDGPNMQVYNADNTKADEEESAMYENQGGKYRKTRRRRRNKSTKKRKIKSKKSRKYRRKTKRH